MTISIVRVQLRKNIGRLNPIVLERTAKKLNIKADKSKLKTLNFLLTIFIYL